MKLQKRTSVFEGGDTLKVWHKETKDRLVIGIDTKEFHLYDRSVEEIGQAIFQAYQSATRDTVLCLGYKEEVVDAMFEARFGHVDFTFRLPVDLRVQELEDWVTMYSEKEDKKC